MERIPPFKHLGAPSCALTILVVLCFYLSALIFNQDVIPIDSSSAGGSCRNPPFALFPGATHVSAQGDSDPVRSLINDLKERARVAGRGQNFSLTAEEQEEWDTQNPCRSRAELAGLYSLRKYAKDLPVNLLWEEIFEEYSNYHRTCMRAVGNIADYFNEGNKSTGCQFVVADTGSGIGLGNKVQVVANAILYGIITRRVILLPTSHLVTAFVCEPFSGSSWVLDSLVFPAPPELNRKKWKLSKEVFRHIDKYKRYCRPGFNDPAQTTNLPYAAGDKTNKKQPFQRFYCPTEQSFYAGITWVYLSGCIYTIPKIFAIPTFRPTLEALFPDKVVLTRIFRSMLLPTDSVWDRVRRVYDAYLQPADRRVGIQIRYLRGSKHYAEMHDVINDRVLDCVTNNGILPRINTSSNPSLAVTTKTASAPPRTKVLVTSLYLSLHDRMTKMYMRYPTVNGETLDLIQLTHEDKQEFGLEVNIQAFTEVLLLSLCDHLVVTPVSTFGGSAQTYGALTPWFIESRKGPAELPSCERSRTVEVCNQYTSKNFDCMYDRELGHKPFSEVVPSIKDCPQIEFPYLSENEQGVQLLTSFSS